MAERNYLGNFDRGPYEEHLGEIILNSGIVEPFGKFWQRFLNLAAVLFGRVESFRQI